jgi:hypothetical protein
VDGRAAGGTRWPDWAGFTGRVGEGRGGPRPRERLVRGGAPRVSVRQRRLQTPVQPVEPFQVVDQANARPFQRHFLPPPKPELPEAEHALDDAEDQFHGLLPQFGESLACARAQSLAHDFGHARTGCGGFGFRLFFQVSHAPVMPGLLHRRIDRRAGLLAAAVCLIPCTAAGLKQPLSTSAAAIPPTSARMHASGGTRSCLSLVAWLTPWPTIRRLSTSTAACALKLCSQ